MLMILIVWSWQDNCQAQQDQVRVGTVESFAVFQCWMMETDECFSCLPCKVSDMADATLSKSLVSAIARLVKLCESHLHAGKF